MSMVQNSSFFFLAFNCEMPNSKAGKIDLVLGYAKPALFRILRQPQVHILSTGHFGLSQNSLPVPHSDGLKPRHMYLCAGILYTRVR